jgi:hypothetical protein
MLDVTMFIPDYTDDDYTPAIDADEVRERERQMTRERYREIWRRVRQNRNARYKTPVTFYPLSERGVYNEIVAARTWYDTDAYAKSFKAHVTLTTLAKYRRQIESGEIVGGGVNGWQIEIVSGEIKHWRAA